MELKLKLPKNPLKRFINIYNALKKGHHYYDSLNSIRYASLSTLMLSGKVDDIVEVIQIYSEDLIRQAGWLDSPHSPIRFVISSMLIQYEISTTHLFEEVNHVSKLFRAANLRNGHIYEKLAILILKTNTHHSVSFDDVQRFKEIYDEMKLQSWWFTSPEYYPACAILASIKQTPKEMADGMKSIYDGLVNAGFSPGKLLQATSHLLFISGIPPEVITARFVLLNKTFEYHQVNITKSDYNELAILCYLNHTAKQVVHSVLNYQKDLLKLKPKPNLNVMFNLAAGITFFDLIQKNEVQQKIEIEEILLQNKQILYAQYAAITSCAAHCNALVMPSIPN